MRKSVVLYVLLFVRSTPESAGDADAERESLSSSSAAAAARRFVDLGCLVVEAAAAGLEEALRARERCVFLREGAREEVCERGREGEALGEAEWWEEEGG